MRILKRANTADPVDRMTLGVMTIKCCVKIVQIVRYGTAGYGHRQPKNIDENEKFVFGNMAQSQQKIVFQHNDCGCMP
jgi:hypothetical protein